MERKNLFRSSVAKLEMEGSRESEVIEQVSQALDEFFPKTVKCIKPLAYQALVKTIVKNADPWNLKQVVEKFRVSVGREPFATTLPYLFDLARLEWAQQEVRSTKYEEALRSVQIDRHTSLQLAQALQVVRSEYDVLSVWNRLALCDEVEVSESRETAVLVMKSQTQVKRVELSLPQYEVLQNIQSGQSIMLSARGTSVSADELADLVKLLKQEQLIVAITQKVPRVKESSL